MVITMADTNTKTMADFQATFFIGNTAVTRMLSDVVKNRDNQLFAETIGLPEDFVLPFFLEERAESVVYTIKTDVSSKYKATITGTGKACNDHVISTGDYVSFKSDDNFVIRVMFIATTEIGLGYKKYRIEQNTNIFIGRTSLNDISCEATDYISRDKHAVIHVDAGGNASIEDLKRTVGIYVNGNATHSQRLNKFDEIYLMGLSIVFMGDYIAVNKLKTSCSLHEVDGFETKALVDTKKTEKYFVSTPRILKSLEYEEIEVDAPPAPPVLDKTPAILLLGPSLTMSMVMLASISVSIFSAINGGNMATVIASATMAVGMLLGSLLWPSLLRSYQKKTIIAEQKHRTSKYSAYISEIEEKLIAKTERSSRILNETLSPSPSVMCSFLDDEQKKLHLWERSSEDEDFLAVRMGVGNKKFDAMALKIPRKGFQLHEDELRELPYALEEKYGTLKNVPLTLDIANNHTIGIIGANECMWTMVNEIILNIISLHSYEEVKLVLVVSPKHQDKFTKFKNVPHIWSDDKKIRYYATDSDEVHYIFNVIDETLKARESGETKDKASIPHYCIIITDPALVEKEALGRYMEDAENTVGLTTVFAYGDITKLPKSCRTIIQSDEERTGFYIKNKNANRFVPFRLDTLNETQISRFADGLSHLPIKRNQRSMGIVDRISFLQMYKAGNVGELEIEKHWDSNNSAKSLAAPIGVMAGGSTFSLDIHEAYHGCHGLVAGTTGSGKSEFLQAFVLSLAINYSPKEIAFVLVDFKGGDMARPFMAKPFSPALPHLAATISNLSGNILYRALVSLEAEIKYRQKVFNESAAELQVDKLDINSYHKYYKGGRLSKPLPHLVIIIDEFAQLKTQQPEFLAQLINVAQVGRSLGIHLILATQKPSGIVDPQIMSNSRFKVCLKVAEKQDSVDMINRPDSAMIKNPGRLNLLVGYNEIYETVQSGYSGADYIPTKTFVSDEEITVQMTDNTANPIHSARIDMSGNKSDKTQLEAVVAEMVSLGQKKHLQVKPLWLEMLSDRISLSSLEKRNKGLCVATVGLVDYVRTQEQKPIHIDFVKNGHIGLYGASGTGKTTFLQTLVYSMVCDYQYTPAELNIYALDFGGRNLSYLDKLPHVGGVVFAGEEQKLYDFVSVLHNLIEERKNLFAASNCGSFSEYRIAAKSPLPAILVLVDNYASFRDKYMDLADELTEIIAAGKTFGMFFVITGNTRNSIYYKVTENISSFYTLRMNDPNNYLDILNTHPPIIPEEISGRGITVINREVVEFQTALALLTETEAERVSAISETYETLASSWDGDLPICVGESENADSEQTVGNSAVYTSWSLKNEVPESMIADHRNLILARSKSGALTYGIELSQDNLACVCVSDESSFSDGYKALLERITEYKDREVIFVDDDSRKYEGIIEAFPTCRYVSGSTEFEKFTDDLKPELNARLENVESRSRQMIIIISEFNSFFDMITNDQAAFMRKVFQYINSPEYGMTFICGFNVQGDKNNDRLFMSLVVNARNYILCSNCYETATAKIETLPTIHGIKNSSMYLCLGDKVTEIRW